MRWASARSSADATLPWPGWDGGRGTGGARQHLERATTLFGEMDMRFWMEQAEAEGRAFGGTSKA